MDPNSTNPPSDNQQPQQDAVQADTAQPNVGPTLPPPPPVNEPNQTPTMEQTSPQESTDTQQSSAGTNPEDAAEDYVEEVGGSLLDLMDEVSGDDKLIQIVADEMKQDTAKVKSTLTTLLDKIDKEQITMEELSLIMAVTVVDENPQENQ